MRAMVEHIASAFDIPAREAWTLLCSRLPEVDPPAGAARRTPRLGALSRVRKKREPSSSFPICLQPTVGKCHFPLNYFNAFLNTPSYLGSGFRSVDYQVDTRRAVNSQVKYIQHGAALPDRSPADIKERSTLLLRAEPYDYRTVEMGIGIEGIDDAVKQIWATCPVKPIRSIPGHPEFDKYIRRN